MREVNHKGEGGGDETLDVLYLFPLVSDHPLSKISGYGSTVFLPVRFCRSSGGGYMLNRTKTAAECVERTGVFPTLGKDGRKESHVYARQSSEW